MILTRNITIIPISKDKKESNGIYEKLKDWQYRSRQYANETVSTFFANEKIKQIIKENKDDIRIENFYNANKEQTLYYKSLTEKYKEFLPSYIRGALSNEIYSILKKEKHEVLKGNKSIRNYKTKQMPIYFSKTDFSFYIDDENSYIFNWIYGIKFKLNLRKDKSSNQVIIDRIINKEYQCCGSKITFKKNKIILNLSYQQSEKIKKLDMDTIVGIDVGVANLAVCGMNKGLDRLYLGCNNSENSIQNIRNIMINKKKDLQKKLILSKGGKGRNRKLKALNNYSDWEKEYMKTKNNQISAEIIKFVIKMNAGIIHLEKLEGIKDNIDNWFRRHWTYYQLQQMIEYKAKMNGIEVRYIDPVYTSKMCSKCGVINKNFTLEDRVYKCDCGNLLDRDYNASINIARSMSYIEKKLRKKDKIEEKIA